jgi:CDP-diacylglycerol--glycerol-3-phosphate 3-phosphatidyltransferase
VTLDDYLARWSALHGGVPPRGLVGGWLRIAHFASKPLVTGRVSPDLITLTGLLVALLALPPAAGGAHWPLLAALTVVLAALLDSLDGAVAVQTDRVSRAGAVLDQTCDRIADLAFVGTLWLAGAPAAWCVAGGALAWLHEQVRSSARGAGMSEVGVVTVSERPTRVIVTAAFLLGAGLYPAAGATWAFAGAIGWTALGLIGLVQLSTVLRRHL